MMLRVCCTGAKRACFELLELPDSAGFAGRTFNERISRYYQAFPQIVGNMIEVAEITGRLSEVLGMQLEFYQF